MSWFNDIVDFGSGVLGGGSSAPQSAGNSFNWGSLIAPAITSAWGIYSGMLNQDAKDASQQALLDEQKRQFDAEMAYKYQALAARGGGGGGGGGIDPRVLAIQRQQANDAAFAKRLETQQMGQKQTSDSIRNLIASYQNAYS